MVLYLLAKQALHSLLVSVEKCGQYAGIMQIGFLKCADDNVVQVHHAGAIAAYSKSDFSHLQDWT